MLGRLQADGEQLIVNLQAFNQSADNPIADISMRLTEVEATLEANTPDLNNKLVGFVSRHRGRPIGNGTCWTVAKDALAAVDAKQSGLYGFGRLLGPREALVPGDILQFEKVTLRGSFHKKNLLLNHHTAIVSDVVAPNRVEILHQDFGKSGKTISRGTIQLDDLKHGMIVAFRPIVEPPTLPLSMLPYRKSKPRIAKNSNGRIDLLKTIDPELDAVHGIWNRVEGPLTCHKEMLAKLQIPVDVPDSYVLRGSIKRIFGDNAYTIILVVDGRQVLLTMDGFKGDQTSGLGLVDGKKENNNETTYVGKIFPMKQVVEITVTVNAENIKLVADGKTIFEWEGASARLSLPKVWSVPNQNWLHLGTYMAEFETSSLTLETFNK